MKFYHGTWFDNYENIKQEGIRNLFVTKSEATEVMDEFIYRLLDGCEKRKNAVYLSDDMDCVMGFDNQFEVDIRCLDTNHLFVGDFEKSDMFYIAIMSNGSDISGRARDYVESIIPFKDYTDDYKAPEYLYFQSISRENLIEVD